MDLFDEHRLCKHGEPEEHCYDCAMEPCSHGTDVYSNCPACEAEWQARVDACENDGGHDWVDDGSHAGPDSGVESLRCTKCPATIYHVLY